MCPFRHQYCRGLPLRAIRYSARFATASRCATNAFLLLDLRPEACRPDRAHRAVYSVMAANGSQTPSQAETKDPIVQYVVMRRDLYADEKWPLGSVIAQACHASAAALWLSKDNSTTQEYCAGVNLDNMHKVVLEVKGETQLRNLAEKLQEAGVEHKLWIEQPEGIPTCLATAPREKSAVQPHFKKFKLCNL